MEPAAAADTAAPAAADNSCDTLCMRGGVHCCMASRSYRRTIMCLQILLRGGILTYDFADVQFTVTGEPCGRIAVGHQASTPGELAIVAEMRHAADGKSLVEFAVCEIARHLRHGARPRVVHAYDSTLYDAVVCLSVWRSVRCAGIQLLCAQRMRSIDAASAFLPLTMARDLVPFSMSTGDMLSAGMRTGDVVASTMLGRVFGWICLYGTSPVLWTPQRHLGWMHVEPLRVSLSGRMKAVFMSARRRAARATLRRLPPHIWMNVFRHKMMLAVFGIDGVSACMV